MSLVPHCREIHIIMVPIFNRSCYPGTLNETLASGKVILCFQSRSQRSAIPATTTVTSARGAGLIFAQFPSKDVSLSSGSLPCVQVDFAIGTNLLTYIRATRYSLVCVTCLYAECVPYGNKNKEPFHALVLVTRQYRSS